MKKYHHNAKKTALAAMVALALSSTGVFAAELPVNGEVVAGQVTVGDKTYVPVGADQQKVYINPATGQTFTVVGNSVIDWSTFDIGSGKALTFVGQGSNYILNRVPWNNAASEIYGILNTQNIHFILANPNGITVGNGAQLNVIDGGSILLAAMGAGFNNANNSITLQNYNYGDRSAINIGGIEAINGNVALMAKTINVADGITFSGDTALKLLAGKTSYNQSITVTPGEGVDSIGSSGSITFNGSLVDDSHKVNLGVSADTITMSADKKIALTGTDSAVNINTGSLQNADITAPVVTLVRDGAITVSNSKLKSTVGDVKVLSGTLSEDGETLSNTVDYSSGSIQNHQITMANSSVISTDDAIIAAAAVDISGKKAGESAAIAAVNDVFIASGKNVPLQSGSLTTETMDTSVTISGAKIKGSSLTLAGNNVRVKNASELTATNDLQIAAAPNITMSDSKAVSGQNNSNYNGNVEITDAALQGKNISLAGRYVTTNGTIGNASTEKVHLLAGQDFNLSADSMGRGLDIKVTGGTITGHDILAEGATVEVANGAAIHAVSAVENEETVAGKVRLLAGSDVTNGVVTATSGNKATVKGTLSGGDIVVAGGAVDVDGGTVNAGTNSAWLLAGNSIKTTAATGSADADGVITSADGNAVTIKKGATVSADKVHIAGYSADLSSATNNSSVTAATEINAVTGSTINNSAGTLVREANAARGRFSRDTASVVTVNGNASSAMIDMPTDGRVISGSVSYKGNSYDASSNYYFNLASGDTITANSHSIINWNTFDIGLSGVLNFDTSNGALLNRVTGSYASWLQGTLNHTGTYPLLLVNPQGIHVYQGATINGANLILSGLDMTDTALSNFSTAGAVAYDTASTGDVNLESGITFSNEAEKLALAGRNVMVAQNTIKAESLKADATNTATLTNLTYTGALEGNSALDSAGGSMTLSGGSYTGNTNLKGTTVNMEVTSHTGDVTVQGTTVGINGGTYTGDLTLAGTSVSVSGVAFDGENKAHNLTLSGLGENGAVTVSNSIVTGARDVTLTGKTVNVSQSGNTRADWTAETFTLGKRESASNTTGITNINLTVTKADTTPTVGNDVALTLNNAAISAPQINLTPASLTLSGGSSLISDTTVGIAAAGSVDVQGASTVKATAGDLNIGANGALTVQGGSNVTAETGDLNVTAAGALTVKGGSTLEAKTGNLTAKGASVAIGVANDTENIIKADAGNITIKAGEDDGRTDANTVNIKNTDLTANADGKSITVTGYSVEAAGNIIADSLATTVDAANGTLTVGGQITVANDLTLNSGKQTSVGGTVAAPNVTVSSNKDVAITGTIQAGSITASSTTADVTLDTNSVLTATGGTNSINVTASAGNITATGTITADSLATTVDAANGTLTVGGQITVTNDLTLNSGKQTSVGGTVAAPNVTVSSNKDVAITGTIQAGSITASSTTADVTLDTNSVLTATGGTNTIDVTASAGSIAAKGQMTAGTITMTAPTLTVGAGKKAIAADTITITAADSLTLDKANMTMANDLNLTSQVIRINDSSVTNTAGNLTISSTGAADLTLTSAELTASSTAEGKGNIALHSAKGITATGGSMTADKNISVTAGSTTDAGATYTTTEDNLVNLGTLTATAAAMKVIGNNTTIVNSTIKANNLQAAGAESINVSEWQAGFADTENDTLTLTNTTVRNKAGDGAIDTVKLAGSNVTFGGGSTDASSFKAESVAVASRQKIAVNGLVNITGADGLSLSGQDITVNGSVNAKKIGLTATQNGITLEAASVLTAAGGANTITLTASNGSIDAQGAMTADTITLTAPDTALGGNNKAINAQTLTIAATDSLSLHDAAVQTVNDLNLTSQRISIADSSVTVTAGDIVVSSTGTSDLALTDAVLTASSEAEGKGNIGLTSASGLSAAGGQLQANNITATAAGDIASGTKLVAAANIAETSTGGNIAVTGDMEAAAVTLSASTADKRVSIGDSGSNTANTIKTSELAVNSPAVVINHARIDKTGALTLTNDSITVTNAELDAGTSDITLRAASGLQVNFGTLTGVNITLDNRDTSAVNASGNFTAAGTLTLGHSAGTATVVIGDDTGTASTRRWSAEALAVYAPTSLTIKNTSLTVTGEADNVLSSETISLSGTRLSASDNLTLQGTSVVFSSSNTMTETVGVVADSVTADAAAITGVMNLSTPTVSFTNGSFVQGDLTVSAAESILLTGGINANGRVTLNTAQAYIGDGSTDTSITAGSVTGTGNLLLNKTGVAVTNTIATTAAAGEIELKGAIDAAGRTVVFDAPTVKIGDGTNNVTVTADKLTNTHDMAFNKAGVQVNTIEAAGKLNFKNAIDATGKTLSLSGSEVNIGDGEAATSFTAAVVTSTSNLVVNKATLNLPSLAANTNSGTLTLIGDVTATGDSGLSLTAKNIYIGTAENAVTFTANSVAGTNSLQFNHATLNVEDISAVSSVDFVGTIAAAGKNLTITAPTVNIVNGGTNNATSITAASMVADSTGTSVLNVDTSSLAIGKLGAKTAINFKGDVEVDDSIANMTLEAPVTNVGNGTDSARLSAAKVTSTKQLNFNKATVNVSNIQAAEEVNFQNAITAEQVLNLQAPVVKVGNGVAATSISAPNVGSPAIIATGLSDAVKAELIFNKATINLSDITADGSINFLNAVSAGSNGTGNFNLTAPEVNIGVMNDNTVSTSVAAGTIVSSHALNIKDATLTVAGIEAQDVNSLGAVNSASSLQVVATTLTLNGASVSFTGTAEAVFRGTNISVSESGLSAAGKLTLIGTNLGFSGANILMEKVGFEADSVTVDDANLTGSVNLTTPELSFANGGQVDGALTVKAATEAGEVNLTGGVNVTGAVTLDAARANIGDGSTDTSITAGSVTSTGNLLLNKTGVAVTSAIATTAATGEIELKGAIDAAGRTVVFDAPTVKIGDGTNNVTVTADKLTNTHDMAFNKAGVQVNTIEAAGKLNFKNAIDATGKTMSLSGSEVNIGDGEAATSFTATAVTSTSNLVVNKATLNLPSLAANTNSGTLTLIGDVTATGDSGLSLTAKNIYIGTAENAVTFTANSVAGTNSLQFNHATLNVEDISAVSSVDFVGTIAAAGKNLTITAPTVNIVNGGTNNATSITATSMVADSTGTSVLNVDTSSLAIGKLGAKTAINFKGDVAVDHSIANMTLEAPVTNVGNGTDSARLSAAKVTSTKQLNFSKATVNVSNIQAAEEVNFQNAITAEQVLDLHAPVVKVGNGDAATSISAPNVASPAIIATGLSDAVKAELTFNRATIEFSDITADGSINFQNAVSAGSSGTGSFNLNAPIVHVGNGTNDTSVTASAISASADMVVNKAQLNVPTLTANTDSGTLTLIGNVNATGADGISLTAKNIYIGTAENAVTFTAASVAGANSLQFNHATLNVEDIRAVSSVDFVGTIAAVGKNLTITAPTVNIVNGGTNNATNITANSMVAQNSAGDAVLNVDTSSLAVGKLGAKTAINFKGDVAVDDSIANMTLEAPVTNVGNGTEFARLSATKVTSTKQLNFNKVTVNVSNIQAAEEVNFQNAITAEKSLNLQAPVVNVGLGTAETSITAPDVTSPGIVATGLSNTAKAQLNFNHATIDIADITADGSINFKNTIKAGSDGTGSFTLTVPVVHVGNGTDDTSVTASAISASADMVVNKAQLNVPSLTTNTSSGSITLIGNVNATGADGISLTAKNIYIGTAENAVTFTAASVAGTNSLQFNHATLNVEDISAVSSVDFVGTIAAAGKNLLLTAPVVNIVNGGTNNATNITANSMVARNSAGDAVLNVDTSSLAVGKLGAKTAINFKGDVAVDDSIANMTLEAPVTNVGNGTESARLLATKVTSTKQLNFNKATVNVSNIEAAEEVNFLNVITAEKPLNLLTPVVNVGRDETAAVVTATSLTGSAELNFNNATINIGTITATDSINFRHAIKAGTNGTGNLDLRAPVIHVGVLNGEAAVPVETAVMANNVTGSAALYLNDAALTVAGISAPVISFLGTVAATGNLTAAASDTLSTANSMITATGNVNLQAANGLTATGGSMEAGGNIVLKSAAGMVSASSDMQAANITLDSEDGSKVSASGSMTATNTITLGHSGDNATAVVAVGDAAIGSSTDRVWSAKDLHIHAADNITINKTGINITGNNGVAFKSGKLDFANSDIRSKDILLVAAKDYDSASKTYTMESDNTITLVDTNLTGTDSITLIGYKTNVKGDVISKRLLGAVGESVTMNADGTDVDHYTYTQEEGANVLTVDGAVATSDESDLIYIKLYGDAKFLNKNDTLQTMSFIANSPYSLAISGDMTVTAESGIRLASESIQIQDNLWANNPNASIELASAGGEMNISGNLRAGKDVILKSAQNIVIGTDDKTVSVTADNGSVKLLAGNFDGRYGAEGEWVSANPAVNGIDLTNTAIAAGENIIVKGGAVNFTGVNELAGDASVLVGNAVLSGTVSGGENTLTMTADNIVVESGTLLTMHEFATRQGNFTLESAAQITADETDLQGETISLANNSLVVSDAVKVKAENAELAGLIYTDKLTAKADNTLTVTETVKNKAGTDDTIVELEGRNVTFVGSSFKTLTVKGTESITLDEGDLYGEDDIALNTRNLTVTANITTANGNINLTGTDNLLVTGSLTAGQQIGLNGKNIQLRDANLNNGADAQTTVAGENAVITGTITTDTGADLSVTAQNVMVGDSGITNIAVSKFTVEGVEQAKFINTNFQADTTVKGKAAVLTGNIDATGYELTLQSTNVTIGDGQTATVMTTKSLADADNLTIDQAVLNLDSYKLQAGKQITLKNTVTAEGQALELAAPDASIGDGSANTVIKAGSVSATDKLLVDKAVLAVDDGTLQAQQIILRGNVTADNLDLTLQAPEAAIGDGIVDTVITARSVMGTEDLLIDKASFVVTNPIIATAGNLTLQHEIVAGDTVGFQAGKAITMQDMSMDKSTDVSFEGKLIDMRDSSINAGKDGKLFFAAYSVKTESPLSYAFQPDNEVIIDNSRLDAGEMTMLGYSIIARNGSEIYADKTLDALAAKKVAMGKLGNLEIVSQATLSTEPQNKLLQQDAIIEVGGRAYHNFRFIPASAYQSDTIMHYLESVNEMPWQTGSDNSPLSIVGIPGLSLYRFQYQDGISDAISGLEMYFTVEPHEGAVREEKEKTNE